MMCIPSALQLIITVITNDIIINAKNHLPHGLNRHRLEYVLLIAHTHAKSSVDNESIISYCS